MATKRIAVTGMAINTPLGDTLDGFLEALLAGRSAISRWKALDTARIYTKIGGELSGYDIAAKAASFESHVSPDVFRRLRRLLRRLPWSPKLTVLVALDAYLNSGLFTDNIDSARVVSIVAGHNINANYVFQNTEQYMEEPDYIDPLCAIHALDTNHAACVSELLAVQGACYTVGGACASGNMALRAAVNEIRYHDAEAAVVVGAIYDFAACDLHAMALLGAVSIESFNDTPELASRPFDSRREGFVPAHGAAALVVEDMERARARGAHIYAEVVGVEASSDGNHLPQPSAAGQARLATRVLRQCNVAPEQIDFISAHATSTPQGDISEIQSIAQAFGGHSKKLKINATKSMLGHTCWSAATVETVAAILQMNASRLHASINIEQLDTAIDLDVCADGPVEHDVRYFMKNSFGFGGINCISIFKRFEE